MSYIASGNTVTTSIKISGDTTGNLIFTTSGANTTALTLDTAQTATFAGSVSLSNITSSANVIITSTAANGTINMNATTGALIIPTGTVAQRPASPVAGMQRYNSDYTSY